MSSPAQKYNAPQKILDHPAWARLEEQYHYYDSKAVAYQQKFKHIKLVVMALSAGIPLVACQPFGREYDSAAKFIIAFCGTLIAMFEGRLLLYQYGSLWTKYRGTAEDLNRERWLLLSQAGDYAEQQPDQAMRRLAARVEAILDTERKSWSEKQQEMQGALAKIQSFVQGHMDETAHRTAAGHAALGQPDTMKAPQPAPA